MIRTVSMGACAAGAALALGGGVLPAAAAELAPTEVEITEDNLVTTPLTEAGGDGYRGVQLFISEERGNCLACHHNADAEGTGREGNLGPSLSLAGDSNAEERFRAILVNAPAVFGPETEMPAFYVADEDGETLLTAQEIEDLVAYLGELQLYLK